MDTVQKLLSDAQRIKKHYRAEHPAYNGTEVCLQIQELFIKRNAVVRTLASAFSDYWLSSRIRTSSKMDSEPTEEHLNVLAAIQALIENDISAADALSADDWKELCAITNSEADDIPLETLNSLMAAFVDKQAM
ncbi:MAG: hypothetical protein J6K96_02150 [Treponema sp.]|nr:hypothetical protein [Treponema sp.]